MTAPRFGVIVPAAGRSTRMGASKPLLRLGDSDFIGTLLATVASLRPAPDPVVVVTHLDDPALADRLAHLSGVTLVVTVDAWAGDMLDSVRAAALRMPDVTAALIWPVDAPAVRRGTVEQLLHRATAHPGVAILPVHAGETGHPALLPRALLDRLVGERLEEGLRGLLASAEPRPLTVAVDDPGVTWNVNTPEAYARRCAER